MIRKIDHIGIAVHSLQPIRTLFRTIFDLEPEYEEEVPDQKVRVLGYRVGESHFEFLEPLDATSPISSFLEKRGEGLHHVAIGVDDVSALLAKMKANNVRLIDETPRKGAGGKQIAFVHPRSLHGVLLELSQEE